MDEFKTHIKVRLSKLTGSHVKSFHVYRSKLNLKYTCGQGECFKYDLAPVIEHFNHSKRIFIHGYFQVSPLIYNVASLS